MVINANPGTVEMMIVPDELFESRRAGDHGPLTRYEHPFRALLRLLEVHGAPVRMSATTFIWMTPLEEMDFAITAPLRIERASADKGGEIVARWGFEPSRPWKFWFRFRKVFYGKASCLSTKGMGSFVR